MAVSEQQAIALRLGAIERRMADLLSDFKSLLRDLKAANARLDRAGVPPANSDVEVCADCTRQTVCRGMQACPQRI